MPSRRSHDLRDLPHARSRGNAVRTGHAGRAASKASRPSGRGDPGPPGGGRRRSGLAARRAPAGGARTHPREHSGVPGHTPGGTAAWFARERVLVAGDAIASHDGRPILGVFNADSAAAKDSFRRLARLNAEVACFGQATLCAPMPERAWLRPLGRCNPAPAPRPPSPPRATASSETGRVRSRTLPPVRSTSWSSSSGMLRSRLARTAENPRSSQRTAPGRAHPFR